MTQLGRGDYSLQPDPLVTHIGIVPRVVLAAWQLWGEGIKTLLIKATFPAPELVRYCPPSTQGSPESRDPLQRSLAVAFSLMS